MAETGKQKLHRYMLEQPERLMWRRTKNRAKSLNIPFNLEISDIIIPEYCPVFPWMKLGFLQERECSPSLDRIDPALGYVKGNVAVISTRANMIKNAGSLKEHQHIVEWLTSLAVRSN